MPKCRLRIRIKPNIREDKVANLSEDTESTPLSKVSEHPNTSFFEHFQTTFVWLLEHLSVISGTQVSSCQSQLQLTCNKHTAFHCKICQNSTLFYRWLYIITTTGSVCNHLNIHQNNEEMPLMVFTQYIQLPSMYHYMIGR